MSGAQLRRQFKRVCTQAITVRRYKSAGGKTDYTIMGHARQYGAKELVNGVLQGDWRVWLLGESLEAKGFPLPLLVTDKLVVKGRERAIIVPADRTTIDSTFVGYECQARG